MRLPRNVIVVVCLMMLGARPAAADGKQVAYAIVIGNNEPPRAGTSETLRPLRYADDDAVRYHQLFSRIAETHLLVVLDTQTQRRYPGLAAHAQPPTVDNLHRVVEDLRAKMTRDRQRGDRPVLYFVFSGHGARDDRGHAFLALLDGALTQTTLYEDVLARMPTTFTHLIVDACHAGGVVGVRGGGFFAREADATSTPTISAEVEPILQATPLARYPQIGVILATTLGQEAHEWSTIESGVFTHELLSGLQGAADVNGDLVVEYTEIQAFVAAANRDIKDPRAIPQVIARPPASNQNAPLLTLSGIAGMRMIRGKAAALGHFYLELENGQRYLDAHLDEGASIVLAVPEATTVFLRTAAHEAVLPARGAVSLDKLTLRDRQIASRGSIEVAYQTALFSSGYGRAYYQGFVDSIGAVGVRFPERSSSALVRTDHRRIRKRIAIGTGVIGGVGAATALTTGFLAYQAHSDFTATTLQRPAHDAQVRYDRYLPIALTSGAVAIVAGAAAWWLWPRSTVQVVPRVEADGGGMYSLSLGARW
ncbi:MAG: peptidase caspase catalytic subunit p20 [Myxococcales bacterium]|nr:peptidase caspase catalytic subunit p20 [Myxococcales bacterium]